MFVEKMVDCYLINKKCKAQDFLDALFDLPADLLPEYWYELEPNPKKNRIYLAKDRARFIEESLEWGVDGHFHHKSYTLKARGFLPTGPVNDDAGFLMSFRIYPGKPKAGQPYDMTDAFRLFEHFVPRLDCYMAYAGFYEEEMALSELRQNYARLLPENDDIADLIDRNFNMARNYADAKLNFPGLVWRSIISQEMVDDYALDLDALKALSAHTKVIPVQGSAGDLVDLQFAEHPRDWSTYQSGQLAPHVYAADSHRCKIRFLHKTVVPNGWLIVQHWEKWLYQGEFAWPK